MKRSEFSKLFTSAIHQSAEEASARTGLPLLESFIVELHGAGKVGDLVSPSEAEDLLYVSDTEFYKIIDVGVRGIRGANWIVFVRPSGHRPVPWSGTRAPETLGPFKVVEFDLPSERWPRSRA